MLKTTGLKSEIALATLTAGMSATFALLSLRARTGFFKTTIKQTEDKHNTRYQRYGTTAWSTGAIVPIAITTGILLWPKKKKVHHRHRSR